MQFQQREEGDFRIYVGAIEAPNGGFGAAVVVEQVRNGPNRHTVFSDFNVSGGHRFASPEEALRHAMDVGLKALKGHCLGLQRRAYSD